MYLQMWSSAILFALGLFATHGESKPASQRGSITSTTGSTTVSTTESTSCSIEPTTAPSHNASHHGTSHHNASHTTDAPKKAYMTISAQTSGVTVGTLTGSALFAAITSAIDHVCDVPTSTVTGNYTCQTEDTAVMATGVPIGSYTFDGRDIWDTSGELDLQMRWASIPSRRWYNTVKSALAAMVQNSTVHNCDETTHLWPGSLQRRIPPGGGGPGDGPPVSPGQPPQPPPPELNPRKLNICKVGSSFQLLGFDMDTHTFHEMSFDLRLKDEDTGKYICQGFENMLEAAEAALDGLTDLPGLDLLTPVEIFVNDEITDACESGMAR